KFIVTAKNSKTLIPCGIPYIFGSVGSSDNDILPVDKMFGAGNVELIIDEAESIQLDEKTVKYKSGNMISY
ncbi:MAG: pyridine nucleotide-disulfide oxidoreductase, partial [Bacteroidales bacterium]|nr:pyridine nucleotide-disulfide oxidoreductase [Bacteroidales bacterium]